MQTINLCVAGATGWTGSAVVEAVLGAEDLDLRSAVSRSAAGGEIGGAPVHASVPEALEGVDVLIDYAGAGKPDAPSGTARELAEALGTPRFDREVADTAGAREARGATVGGTQVHSLRLPSFTVSTEVVFALPEERLSIRHDAGSSAAPYVAGTLLAARAAPTTRGLVRGLDTLLLGA